MLIYHTFCGHYGTPISNHFKMGNETKKSPAPENHEYTNHDTNQRDKAREQKLRRAAAVIGEIKRKYNC